MKKTLSLSLGNGLDALIYGDEERINSILDLVKAANVEGENFIEVDVFRGRPGRVSALSVIGYNIYDFVESAQYGGAGGTGGTGQFPNGYGHGGAGQGSTLL